MANPVIIIGAGQAGLAAAYYLEQAKRDYLVLEAHAQVGDNWRTRWAGLQLFTPNRYNGLPGMAFPGAAYELPTRLAVADYLEAYVAQYGLRVRKSAGVSSLRQNGSAFQVTLHDGSEITASQVILASGAYRTPRVPGFAERLPSSITQIHSANLKDPQTWLPKAGQRILIVGAGASGHQLAIQLSPKHHVTLAGRDPGHLPRRILGRDVYDFLYGLKILPLRVNNPISKLIAPKPAKANERVNPPGEIRVGISVDASAREHGIERCGKVLNYRKDAFHLADGETLEGIGAVVWATGYDNRYDFIDIKKALDNAGKPLHSLGVSPVPGLYWMGLHLMRRMNSSLLGGVGKDAKDIVNQLLTDTGK